MTDPFLEYLREPGPERLSRFILAYTEPVTRLVRRLVLCHEASRDVVQEVFLRLASPVLRAENVPHPRAYILRTALNMSRNHLRDQEVRAAHEHEAGKLRPMASPSAEEEVTAGVSVGVVGSRIQKARQKLREFSGGRELAVAWANLQQAREQGWFPAATEILFREGTVRRPVVLTDSELAIETDVTEGLDDGVPPLQLDRENREVLGNVEFRLVDGDGNPPEPGEPVVEAMNDEEVRVRLQLRTEVRLNKIHYNLRWRTDDGLDLKCENPPPVVFSRPDGTEYEPFDAGGNGGNHCGTIFGIGQADGIFFLAGASNTERANNRPDRPLEYFRPLGEWLDIVELSLSVPDEAVGGTEIPLTFRPASFRTDMAAFIPYSGVYPCNPDQWPEDDTYWRYNVIYHDTFIRVHGDDPEPPPPPDLGIRFVLGTVAGAPGDVVEVPIQAASLEVLSRMRLALELDPAVLSVEGVELNVLDERTDSIVRERIGRPGALLYWVCTDDDGDGVEESCNSGVPGLAWLRDTDESFILLDLSPSPWRADGRLVEIGRLRLRIAEDARPGETILAPAEVPWIEAGFEVLIESGGNLEDAPYSPATEVVEGTVVIEDGAPRRDFVRGDANVDGGIDISDAVLMLNALFADSGRPACQDAADADDNGALNITDPILLLGVLFGGTGVLPPPPECAADPTNDTLGCEEGCAAR